MLQPRLGYTGMCALLNYYHSFLLIRSFITATCLKEPRIILNVLMLYIDVPDNSKVGFLSVSTWKEHKETFF